MFGFRVCYIKKFHNVDTVLTRIRDWGKFPLQLRVYRLPIWIYRMHLKRIMATMSAVLLKEHICEKWTWKSSPPSEAYVSRLWQTVVYHFIYICSHRPCQPAVCNVLIEAVLASLISVFSGQVMDELTPPGWPRRGKTNRNTRELVYKYTKRVTQMHSKM